MEAYAGRGAMEARARKRVEQGEKTVLFEIMEERGRDRLSAASGIARWRATTRWRTNCRGRGRGARRGRGSAVNLLDVEAVVIGGGLGIRLGEPAWSASATR